MGSPDRVRGFTAVGLCKHQETSSCSHGDNTMKCGENNSVRGHVSARMCIPGAAALCFRVIAACGIA